MTTTVELDRFVPGHVLARIEREPESWAEVDGTLVFVDISGFTALSERLATRGRIGAEELTEVLRRVFGDMIDLVAERGGTLLKFGGDALLLLFEGSDHALQAASAAVEMRAVLRNAADIPTSVGKVVLRMSVGVHSGVVDLFAPEGTHTELIVAGPTATHVNLMEGTADAGEIVISSSTKDLLPRGAAERPKGNGWRLSWRKPRADRIVSGVSSDSDTSPGRYMSATLGAHLGAGTPEPEHRMATVTFVKVLGVDNNIAEFGAPSTSRALKDLIGSVTLFTDEEEVTFLATDVDAGAFKIILVSGVPSTLVDQDGRALRVARQITDLDTPFDLKIGINRGHVFSGEVGASHRSTYTIMGDTVNLAARLMAAAPAGAVYVSPQVINRSTTLYVTEPVEPFYVKGKSKPLQALAMGEEAGTRSARLTSTVPFIRRREELDRLRSAIGDVKKGRGSALAVSGPTGIGKSRIVSEALIDADVALLEARSEPYGTANPYRPFRDSVRALLGIERGDNAGMAHQLVASVESLAPEVLPYAPLIGDIAQIDIPPTPESETIDGQFRQDRAIDALMSIFTAAFDGPIVIVAEDMHWADAATQALLSRMAREAADRPWLVIQTCRNEITDEAFTTIVLESFDDEETMTLVHAAAEAAPLRPDEVSTVVARAAGNPLFALELVSAVQESGDIESLPTSLEGVVGSQIDALEPLSRRVLRYLSVLGRSFRIGVARDLLRSQGVELDEATRDRLSEFLEEDGSDRLQFRHAMVRDSAYEGLSFRRREALHLTAGRMVLESTKGSKDPVADILGLHFHLGGDQEKAWIYCRLAGDRMKERYANPEAAIQYERALVSARTLDTSPVERCEVWVKLGDVREQAGLFDAALDAYRHASRYPAVDPVTRSGLLLKRAWVRYQSGKYPTALRESTQAAAAVDGLKSRDVKRVGARVHAFRAAVRSRQGRLSDAVTEAEAAAELAEQSDERAALARAYNVLAFAAMMSGDAAAADRSIEALELYEELGDLLGQSKMNSNLGVIAYFAGDWDRALDYYERSRLGAHQVGNVVDAAFFETNLGELLVNQRRYGEAEERLQNAIRVLRATREVSMATFAEMLMARVYLERGEIERSSIVLKAIIEESTEIGYATVTTEASMHLADCELRGGDPEAALDRLATAMRDGGEEAEEFELLEMRVRALALDRFGDSEEAQRLVDRALQLSEESGSDYDSAMLLLVQRELVQEADPAAAASSMERADALMRHLDMRGGPTLRLAT